MLRLRTESGFSNPLQRENSGQDVEEWLATKGTEMFEVDFF